MIAESTKRLSEASKAAHPEIDWSGIAGFRNFLVHDYMSVDLDLVWRILERDVPRLKLTVHPMLAT